MVSEISNLVRNHYKYYLQMKELNYVGMEIHIYWTIQDLVQKWTLVHGCCLIGWLDGINCCDSKVDS